MTNNTKTTRAKINGLEVENITYKDPRNSLPKFVREAAAKRGYGDATQPLSLFVNDHDIKEAFACAAQGNGSSCVMAQAGTRIGAKSVYFFRTTVWVDFGKGPIVRFRTTRSVYNNVIEPFDRGDRRSVIPGIYHLTAPVASQSLAGQRAYEQGSARKHVKGKANGKHSFHTQAHTERVVMASRA